MDHPLVVRELWIQGCQNLGKSFPRKCLATKDWNLQQVVVWSIFCTDVPRPPFWEDVQLVWLVNKLNMRVSRSKLINGTESRVISEGNHGTEGRLHFETTWIKRQQYHTYLDALSGRSLSLNWKRRLFKVCQVITACGREASFRRELGYNLGLPKTHSGEKSSHGRGKSFQAKNTCKSSSGVNSSLRSI